METHLNRLILLGGSAGGFKAAVKVIANLEANVPAAIILVLHLGPGPASGVAAQLTKIGLLPAALAVDGEPLEAGRIYIAPPDYHTLIRENTISLSRGPRVNQSRPAIDLTFRSAAVSYGTQAIGVILSGMLDDGATGLLAIKRCGGVTVCQDPADALYPDMPQSAIACVHPDHTLPALAIGNLLNRLTKTAVETKAPVPADIMLENRFDLNNRDDLDQMDQLGRRVPVSCPECGGPLWEIKKNGVSHYRCHIGHSLTTHSLLMRQDEAIESTLWIALRTLEEKARMQEKLAQGEQASDRKMLVGSFRQRAAETRAHAERLRKLLLEIGEASISIESGHDTE
ncbi:MAG: chemotaxis protein CheB [Anaerolineae bacterium]|nr:chemotaxis protein CheB [Anaerolineae bacterium]